MPPPQDHPQGHPGPEGPPPPDDGPFGGETAEVGPEPGTVLPVPSTPPPRLREFADRLGVSGEKREKFFALQLKMIATMREGRWRIQQLRRAVRVEMLSDRPDRNKIEANLAAIQSAQLALERQTVRTILDTREILDGEAERQYLEFITRMRLGAGEPKPNGPRPRGDGRMLGRPGLPGGQPGFDPRREPPAANPQNPSLEPGQNQPGQNLPGQDPRLNRPGVPRGGGFGGRPGGFGRPRLFPRGERMLTPEERLERRRRFEEWQARQGAGQTAPPPQRSEPEGEAPPPA
jgi:Spy/CpxP family protein refolding chaperone